MAGPDQHDSSSDPCVSIGFALGWQVARLHATAIRKPDGEPKHERRLPGVGNLPTGIRTGLGIDAVEAALHRLRERVEAAGAELPSTEALREVWADASSEADSIRHAVYQLHIETLLTLMATDFRLGKGYGLGVALAQTYSARSWEELGNSFAAPRIAGLRETLADLESALPTHSAHAVSESLAEWCAWVRERAPAEDAEESLAFVSRILPLHGNLWRALLSGEKQGQDMLGVDDYVRAADRLVARSRRVVGDTLKRYRAPLAAALLIFSLGVVTAFAFDGTGEIVAGVTTAAAALGVSWKGVGSALAALARELREPLWQIELDHAIADRMIPREPRGPDAAGLRRRRANPD